MASFTLKSLIVDNCVVMEITGYFAAEAGRKLDEDVDAHLRLGKTAVVLDFTKCDVVSSPGIASLMDICLKVTEDFKGKIAMCGLDPLKSKVFYMAGIVSIAPAAETRELAIKSVK